MKNLFLFAISIVVILSVLGICSTLSKESELSNNDYLRIHIRANSNAEVDQNVKYQIKDVFIDYLTPKLSFCDTKQKVIDLVLTESVSLENLANSILNDNGFNYVSSVKINKEMFPTRTYDGYTLESGVYDAIIVELGSAQGNNWWCVIYPPLCFVNYSNSNFSNVVYKSKLLEIIKQFFNK